MDIETIIDSAKQQWDNPQELAKLKLEVVTLHEQTARELGSSIGLLSQTFITEKDNGYNMTVTEAEHRGKAATGGMHETFRARLHTLTHLYESIRDREMYLVNLPEIVSSTQS